MVENKRPFPPSRMQIPDQFEYARKILTPTTEHPLAKTSWIGGWFFTWTNKIFRLAHEKVRLKNSELYAIGAASTSATLQKKFNQMKSEFGITSDEDDIYIARKMIRDIYKKAIYYFITVNILEFSLPLVVKLYYTKPESLPSFIFDIPKDHVHSILLAVICMILFFRYLFLNQAIFNFKKTGQLTSILRPRIILKLLSLQAAGTEKYNETTTINMLTTDLDNLAAGLTILPDFINALFLFVFGYYYIYKEDNEMILILFCLLLASIGMYRFIFSKTSKYRESVLEMNDAKCRLVRNLLRDIKFIKTNRCEKILYDKIMKHQLIQDVLTKKVEIWDQVAYIIRFYLPTIFAFIIFGYSIFKYERKYEEESSYLVLTVLSIIKNPIKSISEGFRKYPSFIESQKRLNRLFSEKSRIMSTNNVNRKKGSFGMIGSFRI